MVCAPARNMEDRAFPPVARPVQPTVGEVTVRWDHKVVMGIALAAAACDGSEDAGSAPPPGNAATPTGADTADETPPENPTPDDTDTEVVPAWWSVDAELVVVGGAIDPAVSTWRVSLWAEDETPLPCMFDVPIDSAGVEEAVEVEAGTLVGWWLLSLDAGPLLPACPIWPAGDLLVGLGPYDPRLDAASDAHEWLDLDLYGLYLQLDPEEGPVLVVGVAGTEEQFLGEAAAVVGPPLPDGTYAATTLVLLAL